MKKILVLSLSFFLGACAQMVPPPREPSAGHIKPEIPAPVSTPIPAVVDEAPVLPPPQPEVQHGERYTVVVNEVPVKELLFAIARDANMNVDINPGVSGVVTLNAVQQTLPQILSRISEQSDIRYEIKADRISVSPDLPFARTYPVNYINMSRDVSSTTNVATQIDTSTDTGAGSSSSSSSQLNNSTTAITSTSNQRFWETLTANVLSILGQVEEANSIAQERIEENTAENTGDALGVTGESRRTSRTIERRNGLPASDRVIVNRETGLMTVVATQRQHNEVQKFLDQVMAGASRQVLVEATIVEVTLSDRYRAGIDWAAIAGDFAMGAGLNAGALPGAISLGTTAGTLPISGTSAPFSAFTFGGDNFNLGIRLLKNFGNVQVLSSPKAMVLNNQTAVLKVVDNQVFFTIEADTTTPVQGGSTTTVTTTPHSVAVGLVMSVTPQINPDSTVMLNVRPTISRISGFAADPNPAPVAAGLDQNLIPIIQTRELESMLMVPSGQTAVLGGLMQDNNNIATRGTPGLQDLPAVGELFKQRDNQYTKSELVIFIRPTVIKRPGLNGDFKEYNQYLSPEPEQGFPPSLNGREAPCYRKEPGCAENRICHGDWCQ